MITQIPTQTHWLNDTQYYFNEPYIASTDGLTIYRDKHHYELVHKLQSSHQYTLVHQPDKTLLEQITEISQVPELRQFVVSAYKGMVSRCKHHFNKAYDDISVHPTFKSSSLVDPRKITQRAGFRNWLVAMGEVPATWWKLEELKDGAEGARCYWTIDRIDSLKDYEPDNIRWLSEERNRTYAKSYSFQLPGKVCIPFVDVRDKVMNLNGTRDRIRPSSFDRNHSFKSTLQLVIYCYLYKTTVYALHQYRLLEKIEDTEFVGLSLDADWCKPRERVNYPKPTNAQRQELKEFLSV